MESLPLSSPFYYMYVLLHICPIMMFTTHWFLMPHLLSEEDQLEKEMCSFLPNSFTAWHIVDNIFWMNKIKEILHSKRHCNDHTHEWQLVRHVTHNQLVWLQKEDENIVLSSMRKVRLVIAFVSCCCINDRQLQATESVIRFLKFPIVASPSSSQVMLDILMSLWLIRELRISRSLARFAVVLTKTTHTNCLAHAVPLALNTRQYLQHRDYTIIISKLF